MPLANPVESKNGQSSTGRIMTVPRGPSAGAHASIKQTRYAWKVVHACEIAREVLPLVEGQIVSGMRPFLLTPGGSGFASTFRENQTETAAPVPLLQTW